VDQGEEEKENRAHREGQEPPRPCRPIDVKIHEGLEVGGQHEGLLLPPLYVSEVSGETPALEAAALRASSYSWPPISIARVLIGEVIAHPGTGFHSESYLLGGYPAPKNGILGCELFHIMGTKWLRRGV
jgi:hypothetical protein